MSNECVAGTMADEQFNRLPMFTDVVKGENRSAYVGSILLAPPMSDKGYEKAQVTGFGQVPSKGTDLTHQFRMALLVTGCDLSEERWAYDDLSLCHFA